MQFLKTLFWSLLAILVAVFSIGNWTTVPIQLWAGLVADVNLPLLLLVTFLSGFVPVMLLHHAVRWRLRQRLATAERAIADLRGAAAMSPVLPPSPLASAEAESAAMPPAANPMAVPPGGA